MRLFSPDQMPSVIQGRACRQSRLVSVVGAVVMALMLLGVPLFILSKAELAGWIWILVLVPVFLIAWGLSRLATKAFADENWLLRIAPEGLWINLRSYLNREFAPARTVLFLPYVEIQHARRHSVKRAERSGSRTAIWTDHYLEIELREPAIAELSTEIAEERRRVVESAHLGGLVTSRGRHHHVPVTLPADDRLRIQWRGRQDFVVPGLKRVLRELAAEVTVLEATVESAENPSALSAEQVDRLILERVEAGDTFGATKLLRDERAYSLRDAKKFVDELTAKL